MKGGRWATMGIAACLVLLLSVWHLSLGAAHIDWLQPSDLQQTIIWDIRFPRLVLVLLNGWVLGFSGAILQLLLRNPLAEPGLLGVSSMSALTTITVLYFGGLSATAWALPLVALCGGLLGLLLVVMMAGRSHNIYRVILAGVAVSSLAGAAMGLVLYLAPNPFAFQEWSLWTLGSFANRSWSSVWLVLPAALIGILLSYRYRDLLSALTLSEATVVSLGFRLLKHRNLLLLAVAIMVAGSVVSVGIIGFIGLLAPHVVRLLGAQHPQSVMWLSGPAGLALLLLMDNLARVVSGARELPVGIISALIGAPLLVILLWRQRVKG